MDTVARVKELTEDRNITFYRLAQISGVSYTTLKNAEARGGQLSVDSIERICEKLGIPVYEFFMTDEDWEGIEEYAIRRVHYREEGAKHPAAR